jgi:Co/Zn/Cd efflux system component
MVGALVILSWAWGLVRTTSAVLLDHMPHDHKGGDIQKILMAKEVHLKDMHLFRVGAGKQAVILSVATALPLTATEVHEWLKPLELAHITVEITNPN